MCETFALFKARVGADGVYFEHYAVNCKLMYVLYANELELYIFGRYLLRINVSCILCSNHKYAGIQNIRTACCCNNFAVGQLS